MKFAHALLLSALLPTGAMAQAALDTGSASVQSFTPANASHVAGKGVGAQTATALGALLSFPVARAPGGSGLALQISVASAGGDVPTLQVRLWDVLPANTTCEDNTSYVGSATDDAHLITPPFTLGALAAPPNTTGDAKTYVSISWTPPLSFRNQDATRTVNVYGCLVATSTFTPAAAAYAVTLTAVQD
jgi:hypothetical protein